MYIAIWALFTVSFKRGNLTIVGWLCSFPLSLAFGLKNKTYLLLIGYSMITGRTNYPRFLFSQQHKAFIKKKKHNMLPVCQYKLMKRKFECRRCRLHPKHTLLFVCQKCDMIVCQVCVACCNCEAGELSCSISTTQYTNIFLVKSHLRQYYCPHNSQFDVPNYNSLFAHSEADWDNANRNHNISLS